MPKIGQRIDPSIIPDEKPAGAKAHEGNGRSHNYARVFETFGVEFSVNGSGEAQADACPWCGKDRFHLNIQTGLYHCKHCGESGNVTTYLTWLHGQYLAQTTADHYLVLKAKRGIASQTLRLHDLAYDADKGCWLIPFRNPKGSVVNVQMYYPDRPKPNKFNLPELPTSIYRFDKLSDDKRKIVFLCEGPFDAIALDYSIGATNRPKYTVLAAPGAFKEEWAPHFKGRKVRALYDNDKGGQQQSQRVQKLLGESGVAGELRVLKWPAGLADGYDVNDLVCSPEFKGRSVLGFLLKNSVEVTAEPSLDYEHGWDRKKEDEEPIDWPWPDHLCCGTYVSFSGQQGTLKSTIARELIARYTKGEKMPSCDRVGMPAGHVIYITAEDDKKRAWESLEFAEADLNRVTVMKATKRDGDPLNVLENLPELRQLIRQHDVRLVIIDGQNSVVGAPPIDTDMKARHNVTNKLHQFAQQQNVCLIGIRNEDPTGRAMGPQSMGDIGRCVLRAVELPEGGDGNRYFNLIFKKVSDVSPKLYPPVPYSVEDCGGNRRRILWGKPRPDPARGLAAKLKAALDKARAAKGVRS